MATQLMFSDLIEFSHKLLSFTFFDPSISGSREDLGDNILTFDSASFKWLEFGDLKDMDFPNDLTAPSFELIMAVSLTDFCFTEET